MMHKEIVVKKKAPVIAISLLIITFMLYIHEGLKFIKFESINTLKLCNIIIIALTILILLREIISCNISYKYSVIADKLIVNKICGSNEKNLANVKISDIEYIGPKAYAPKDIKCKSVGSFVCSLLGNNTCTCIYSKNGKYYRFSFEPSDNFICRINKKLA